MMNLYGDLASIADHLASRRAEQRKQAYMRLLLQHDKKNGASLWERILGMKRSPASPVNTAYTPASAINA